MRKYHETYYSGNSIGGEDCDVGHRVSPPVHPRVRLLMGRAGSHQGTPPTKTIFLTTFTTTAQLDTLLMFHIGCPLCKYANSKNILWGTLTVFLILSNNFFFGSG